MGPILNLVVHEGRLAIVRFPPDASLPAWAGGSFLSLTRSEREMSLVCREALVPADLKCERGWRRLSVDGILDFSLTGILASVAGPLAEAGIPLFAVSTHDTDHFMVKDRHLLEAVAVLIAAGHRMVPHDDK